MTSHILCIFEGERRDIEYFESLYRHFFSTEAKIQCSYGNNLYHLLRELEEDSDLDIVELIRESEIVPANEELLRGIERDEIAQVFLFFDMEAQDTLYSAEKLHQLVECFGEETEFGKLYVSYPMVEALRHVPSWEDFMTLSVTAEQCRGKVYKGLSVQQPRVIPDDHRKLTRDHWQDLINYTTTKARTLTDTTSPEFPSQLAIAEKQSQVLKDDNKIYVMSAFPFFLREYFGEEIEGEVSS